MRLNIKVYIKPGLMYPGVHIKAYVKIHIKCLMWMQAT